MKYLILITFLFSISMYSFAETAEKPKEASSEVAQPVGQCPPKDRRAGKGTTNPTKPKEKPKGATSTSTKS